MTHKTDTPPLLGACGSGLSAAWMGYQSIWLLFLCHSLPSESAPLLGFSVLVCIITDEEETTCAAG